MLYSKKVTYYFIPPCHYCGIRRNNQNAVRYRLMKDEFLACCEEGYRRSE